jgi:hypothetical protein
VLPEEKADDKPATDAPQVCKLLRVLLSCFFARLLTGDSTYPCCSTSRLACAEIQSHFSQCPGPPFVQAEDAPQAAAAESDDGFKPEVTTGALVLVHVS